MNTITGKVWNFGANIDTDVIIAARYLNSSDPEHLAKYVMEDADPEFPKKLKKGDIIVAGENFGCGSSREHAPIALKAAGIAAVVAPSFARIFYRNAFNMGLPIFELPESLEIKEGEEQILNEFAFNKMIQKGLKDSKEGKVISNKEMKKRIQSW